MLGLLLWDYFHGGVPAHHLLDQPDLPVVSNWWSGLWLPLMTWVLLGKIEQRMEKFVNENAGSPRAVVVRFAAGLACGLAITVSFVTKFTLFLENVPYLLVALGFFLPLFFSEFILGFVLAMTYTFGAILPSAFIFIIALVGWVPYRVIRPRLVKWIR